MVAWLRPRHRWRTDTNSANQLYTQVCTALVRLTAGGATRPDELWEPTWDEVYRGLWGVRVTRITRIAGFAGRQALGAALIVTLVTHRGRPSFARVHEPLCAAGQKLDIVSMMLSLNNNYPGETAQRTGMHTNARSPKMRFGPIEPTRIWAHHCPRRPIQMPWLRIWNRDRLASWVMASAPMTACTPGSRGCCHSIRVVSRSMRRTRPLSSKAL